MMTRLRPRLSPAKSALAHLDAGINGHQVIGIFDRAIPLRIVQFTITVTADPIELQQPVLEATPGIDLAGTHLAGFRVPVHNGLGMGTACRGANAKDICQDLFVGIPPEAGLHRITMTEHF